MMKIQKKFMSMTVSVNIQVLELFIYYSFIELGIYKFRVCPVIIPN